MRDRLEAALKAGSKGLIVHAADARRLPNTLYAAFPGVDAIELLARTDGIATGSGAACHSGVTTPSKVLTAMGVKPEIARSTLRLTTGRSTTADEIDRAAAIILTAVKSLAPGART
jgi:cysteine desulfurase